MRGSPLLRCGLALAVVLGAGAAAVAASSLKERSFTFTYQAVVKDIPAKAKTVDIWVPFPTSDAHQTVRAVRIDAPASIQITREPVHGNQSVYLRVSNPRAQQIPITVSAEVTRRENAGVEQKLTAEERKQYLQADALVPLSGRIRELGVEVTKGKRGDAAKARAIYDYVTGTMKYDKSGTGWGNGDAIWACDAKRGNCTDFHALLIGMARSQGIPARFSMGIPLPAVRGQGEIPGYHCWAEMYVGGRWIPVDSSEAAKGLATGKPELKDYFYGHHDENRILLSRGRDIVLTPAQKGKPLNYFVYPHVEVDGKPHTALDRKFSYADQGANTASR